MAYAPQVPPEEGGPGWFKLPDDFPTADRFDRNGAIRYVGRVADKSSRKSWVIARRKGSGRPHAITEAEWRSLAESPAAVHALTPRFTVFGMQ